MILDFEESLAMCTQCEASYQFEAYDCIGSVSDVNCIRWAHGFYVHE